MREKRKEKKRKEREKNQNGEREKQKQNKKLIQKIGFFFWTTQKVMRIERCVVFCFLFLKFKKIRFPFSLLILILLPFSTWFQLLFLLFFSSVIWKRKTPSFFLVLLGTVKALSSTDTNRYETTERIGL